MSEIHFIERVPRRPDFCGCPPCHLCYEPVISDDQQAPTFDEVMKEIYQERPAPQTEQEYEWAHAAAHETRQELEALRLDGTSFEEQDRAHMTAVQIEDMLKQARKAAVAPKPLNRVNLDDMPVEVVEIAAAKKALKPPTKSPAEIYAEAQKREMDRQQAAYNNAYESAQAINQQVMLQSYYSSASAVGGPWTMASEKSSSDGPRKGP